MLPLNNIEREEEVLEVRRGNAAVCGPFRPLVSLRSRRTALDVTKTGSSREPLSWVSWTTCRLYYSPVKWLAVVNVAATVRIPMCRPQAADPEVPGWTPCNPCPVVVHAPRWKGRLIRVFYGMSRAARAGHRPPEPNFVRQCRISLTF